MGGLLQWIQSTKNIIIIYYLKIFVFFKNSNFSDTLIMETVASDYHANTVSISHVLNIAEKRVSSHRKTAAYTKKLDVRVQYELTRKNLMERTSIRDSLLNRNKTHPSLKRIVTDDDWYITCSSAKRNDVV